MLVVKQCKFWMSCFIFYRCTINPKVINLNIATLEMIISFKYSCGAATKFHIGLSQSLKISRLTQKQRLVVGAPSRVKTFPHKLYIWLHFYNRRLKMNSDIKHVLLKIMMSHYCLCFRHWIIGQFLHNVIQLIHKCCDKTTLDHTKNSQ